MYSIILGNNLKYCIRLLINYTFKSYPHWLACKGTKCTIKSLWGSSTFKWGFIFFWPELKVVGIFLIEWLHWELLLIVFEQCSQFEIVLGIKVGFHCHIILNKFKEFLLELIYFFSDKEWIDESEICIGKISIIPNFLCYKQWA